MKIHTRKPWLLLTAICAAAGTAPGSAGQPDPVSIVRRAVAAHRVLGPVTVTARVITPIAPVGRWTIRRNDRDHFVMIGGYPDDHDEYYVNGKTTAIYWPKGSPMRSLGKDYEISTRRWGGRYGEYGPMDHESLERLLSRPDERQQLAQASVTTIPFHGESVYCITPKKPIAGLEFSTLMVGRKDSLIREMNYPQSLVEITANYEIRRTLFPLRTFVFHPPPGTKGTRMGR